MSLAGSVRLDRVRLTAGDLVRVTEQGRQPVVEGGSGVRRALRPTSWQNRMKFSTTRRACERL